MFKSIFEPADDDLRLGVLRTAYAVLPDVPHESVSPVQVDVAPLALMDGGLGQTTTGVMAGSALSVAATGNPDIDGLLSGVKWSTNNVTYNFPTSSSYYPVGYPTSGGTGTPVLPTGFTAVTESFKAMVRVALGEYSTVTGLTFTEVAVTDPADVSVARTTQLGVAHPSGFTGYGYYPGSSAASGDVWFSAAIADVGDSLVLSRGTYRLVMHELGHAMGLKHSQDVGGPANIVMPANHDFNDYTVMSYRLYQNGPTAGNDREAFGAPQSLMMYDILTLQTMYGANYTTNSGDTVYSFSPTTGQMLINGVGGLVPGANRVYRTVWDGGGTDTYDFSNYTTGLVVDLTPGGKSTLSAAQLALVSISNSIYATGNLFNALQFNGDPRSLIENVNGGSGDDVLKGNAANNVVTGNAGNDTADGGAGIDTFVETYASSAGVLAHTNQSANGWRITGGGYVDTLANIEKAQFTDATVTLRQAHSNFNFGAASNDVGATSDILLMNAGTLVNWTVQSNSVAAGALLGTGLTGWSVKATGDTNADGDADLILQNGGDIVAWNMQGGALASGALIGTGAIGWSVVGAADLNNDGDQDLILQNGGTIVAWNMQNGALASGALLASGATGWNVVGTGDFFGDGSSDLLLQNGGNLVAWNVVNGAVAGGVLLGGGLNGWSVKATGDVNGDGQTDIILQNGGTIVDWTVANGVVTSGNVLGTGLTGWNVVASGDYNGDGTSDILLQNGGSIVTWDMLNGVVSGGVLTAGGATGWVVVA